MKILGIAVLIILLAFIGLRIYTFWTQEHQLDAELSGVQNRLTEAQTEETDLQSDVQYLANPANLEKEIRARFNYKRPGETMVVIVPATSTPTSTD